MTSESTSVETLEDIRETVTYFMGQVREMKNMFTTYTNSIQKMINEGDLARRVTKIDNDFQDVKKRVDKIKNISALLLSREEILNELPNFQKELTETIGLHAKRLNKLHTTDKELEKKIGETNEILSGALERTVALEEFRDDEQQRLLNLKNEITQEYIEKIQFTRQESAVNLNNAMELLRQEYAQSLAQTKEEFNIQLDLQKKEYTQMNEERIKEIEELKKELNDARERIEKAKEESIDQAAVNVQDIRDVLAEEQKKIQHLEKKAKKAANDIVENNKNTNTRIDELVNTVSNNKEIAHQEVDDVQQKLDALKEQISQQDKSNEITFGEIKENADNLHEQDEAISERINQIEIDFTSLIEETAKSAASNLEYSDSQINQDITKLSDFVKKFRDAYKTFTKEKYQKFVDETGNNFNSVNEKIEEIHAIEDEIKKNHNELCQTVDDKEAALQAQINELKTDNETMNTKVYNCNKRNDEIASKINFIQGEEDCSLTDLKLTLTKAVASLDNTQKELKDGLAETKASSIKSIEDGNKRNEDALVGLRNELASAREDMAEQLDLKVKNVQEILEDTEKRIMEEFNTSKEAINNIIGDSDATIPQLTALIRDIDQQSQTRDKEISEKHSSFSSHARERIKKLASSQEVTTNQIELRKQEIETFTSTINQRFEESRNNTQSLIDKQNKQVEEFQNTITERIETNENEQKESSKQMKDEISQIMELLESIEPMTNQKIKDANAEVVSRIEQSNKEINNKVGIIQRLTDAMKGNSDITLDGIVSKIETTEKHLTEMINTKETKADASISELTTRINTIEQGATERNNTLLEKMNKQHEELSSSIQTTTKEQESKVNELQQLINNNYEEANTKIESISGSSSTTIPDLIGKIKEIDSSLRGEISKINELRSSLEQTFKERNNEDDAVHESLKKQLKLRQTEIENLQNLITSQISETKQVFTGDYESMKNLFQDLQESVEKKLTESTATAIERENKLKSEIKKTNKTISTNEEKNSEQMAEFKTTINEQMELSINGVRSQIDTLNDIIKTMRGSEAIDLPSLVKSVANLEKLIEKQVQDIKNQTESKNATINARITSVETAANEKNASLKQTIDQDRENTKEAIAQVEQAQTEKRESLSERTKKAVKKLEEKINLLSGGSSTNLNDVSTKLNEFTEKTTVELSKNAAESASLKSKQEKLGNELKDQLTNEFMSALSQQRADNDALQAKIESILEGQKEFGTKKDISTIESKMAKITGESKTTIPNLVEEINNVKSTLTTSVEKLDSKTSKRVKSLQEQQQKLSDELRALNGGSDQSLVQLSETIRKISVDFASSKQINETNTAKINSEITEINNQIVEMNQNNSTQFQTVENTLKEELLKTNNKIEENHRELTQQLQSANEKISSNYEKTSSRHKKFKKDINEKIDSINEQLVAADTKLGEDIVTNVEKLVAEITNSKTIIASNKDELDAEISELNNKITVHEDSLANSKNEILHDVKKNVSIVKKTLQQSINENQDKSTASFQQLRSDFEAFKGGAKQNVPAIMELITTIQHNIQVSDESIESRFQEIAKVASDSTEEVNGKSKQRKKKLKAIIGSISTRIDANKSTSDDSVRQVQHKLLKEIKEMESRQTQQLVEASTKLQLETKKVADNLNKVQTATQDQFSTVTTDISDIRSRMKEAQTRQKTDFDGFSRSIDEKVQSQLASSTKSLNKAKDKMNQEVNESLSQVREEMEKVKQNVDATIQLADDIQIKAQKIADKSAAELRAQIQGVESYADQTRNENLKAITALQGHIEEIKKDTQIVGQNLTIKIDGISNDFSTLKDSTTEQIDSTNSQIEKLNKQFKRTTQEIMKSNQEMSDNLNNKIDESLQEASKNLTEDVDKVVTELRGEMETSQSSIRTTNDELRSAIHDLQENNTNSIKPQIKSLKSALSQLDKDFDSHKSSNDNDFMKTTNKTDELTNNLTLLYTKMDKLDSRTTETINQIRDSYAEAQKKIELLVARSTQDLNDFKVQIEGFGHDIVGLKHIHHFNAEYEQFNKRFDESLVKLSQFQRQICNFVYKETGDKKAQNSQKPVKGEGISKLQKQKPPAIKKIENYDINTEITNDMEIGMIIFNALQTHSTVTLTIPAKTNVVWNKQISLLPRQSLIINGERGSSISMDGSTQIGDMADPSRAILDGYSILQISGAKIIANSSVDTAQPSLDLQALFVARCWDAAGPSLIQIEGIDIESDVPIVNVGANAFAHIKLFDLRITNKSRFKNYLLKPVTCESGGYPTGYGSVSAKNIRFTKTRVEWCDSDCLIQPDTKAPTE